jgi:hypothetical protein
MLLATGQTGPISWHPDLRTLLRATSAYGGYMYIPTNNVTVPLRANITGHSQRRRVAVGGGTWEELDYHVDVCRVTNGARIKHL